MRYGTVSSGQDEKWFSFHCNGRLHKIRVSCGKMFEAEIKKGQHGYYVSELIVEDFNSKSECPVFKSNEETISNFKEFHIPYNEKTGIYEFLS